MKPLSFNLKIGNKKNDFNERKLLIVSTILANPPNRKKYVITTFKGFSNKFLYSIYTFDTVNNYV